MSTLLFIGTWGETGYQELAIDYPLDPVSTPSDTARYHISPSGKVYTTAIGNQTQRAQRFARTYSWLEPDKANEILDFFGIHCLNWTKPFSMDDPLLGSLTNVFADRSSFLGMNYNTNSTLSCRLHFIVGT